MRLDHIDRESTTSDMSAEAFKGGVHYGMGSLAAAMCLYNAMSFGQTREGRLLVNVGIYAMLWAFEWHHVRSHAKRS